jgi:hypothetical protein
MPLPDGGVKKKAFVAARRVRLFQQARQVFNDFGPGDGVAVPDDANLHGADGVADKAGQERVAAAADERRRERKEGVAGPVPGHVQVSSAHDAGVLDYPQIGVYNSQIGDESCA